jgi:uncharacterized damage-inducible protein DinB
VTGPAWPDRFCRLSADCLGDYLRRITAVVEPLSEDQVWWRANPATNSVGNLLLHLQGNLSQWVLAALGGRAYERHRSQEFSASRTAGKAELLAGLGRVVGECQAILGGLPERELAAVRTVQGGERDGLYIVLHVVEHMSYHTGQIVHLAKEQLGPAAGIDFFPQHRNE